MGQPSSYDEFLKRVGTNQMVSGYGVESVIHMPCPFCGAGHFVCYNVLQCEEALSQSNTCDECHRSSKCVFEKKDRDTSFTLVQTGGPDCPQWFPFHMKRLC